MHTTNPHFDEWFQELEGYAFVSEKFYADLDVFAIAHKNKDEKPENYRLAQVIMKKWLEQAFLVGCYAGKKERH